jgi:hypothetical protein
MNLSVYVNHDLSFAVTQLYRIRSHITFKFEATLNNIKLSEYLTNVVTIDLCCLNNYVMLLTERVKGAEDHIAREVYLVLIHLERRGSQWRSWLRHFATSQKVAVRFLMVSLEFFIDIILLVTLCPWG